MIHKKILELCQERNVSVFAVEKDTGLGNGTISKWRNSVPTVDKLKKIADYFGVSIEYFLSEDEQDSGVTVEELASGG